MMRPFVDKEMAEDGRLYFPATLRNRDVIKDALVNLLSHRESGHLLEIASGSGEHATHIGPALPGWRWQASDIEPAHIASINAWNAYLDTGLPPALLLDVATRPWPIRQLDVVFSANLIHIAPPNVTDHLLRGAREALNAGGLLILYGPFMKNGVHSADSNAAFDARLKDRDPSWGVRDIETIKAVAKPLDLDFQEERQMPANNHVMVLRRR